MKSTHHSLDPNSDAFDQSLTSHPPQRLYQLTYRGLSYDRPSPPHSDL
ncbi:MAG: hypothetical protein HC881_21845 [Leptolyngbyaceae cyanobacterium SL_7_1]|nr:hypothetical protein [Leptolyngbyaceae cyanobacterium SL_7_1]